MNNLNQYIIEKLKLNKNIKIEQNDKDYLCGEIYYHVKHVLEDDYKISKLNYNMCSYDERKCKTNSNDKTWFIGVLISKKSELSENIIESLSYSLDYLSIDKRDIKCDIYNDNKFFLKIFLYDPE